MSDVHDPLNGPDPDGGYLEEAPEVEAPRRAASAEFEVNAEVGSQAALRDAMDPANQSLADALRLSFRILQLVILVLVVLFVFSGVRTVDEGETGVLTRWGRIVPVGGDEALAPGLRYSLLPYPAGEFVLFSEENRVGSVERTFWPDLQDQTRQRAMERARTSDELRPGRDGYLLTRDGDIAHLRIAAEYRVEDPVSFVGAVRETEADRFVTLALERACLSVAVQLSLQEIIDLNDEHKDAIRLAAQRTLDELGTGLRIDEILVPEPPSAAFAIEQSRQDLQEAIVAAERTVEAAGRRADEILTSVSGPANQQLVEMIEQYEDALDLDRVDEAETVLTAINDLLDSDLAAGEVSSIISDARSYGAQIEVSLGAEAVRFRTQLENFRRHPGYVVQEAWMNAYQDVISRSDAELFFLPPGTTMAVKLFGLDEIAQTRRERSLQRREQQAINDSIDRLGLERRRINRGSDYDFDGPGRQLDIEGGRISGRN